MGTYGKFLSGGETIELNIPERIKSRRKLTLPLHILFEDDHLAIVHKRAGILVSGNCFLTIANALEQNLITSSEKDAVVPLPVHRLDYPTTGLVLVGKTNSCIRNLYKLFEDKQVDKEYLAITIGEMKESDVINSPIDDKPSVSEFKVLDFVHSERFGRLNLVKLCPKTGRRHQLRKHLAGFGNPILGDKEYGKEGLLLNKKGLYLHAYLLKFQHPITGETICVKDENWKRFEKIFPDINVLH